MIRVDFINQLFSFTKFRFDVVAMLSHHLIALVTLKVLSLHLLTSLITAAVH